MDLKTLQDIPPWEWPRDSGKRFKEVLIDRRANESDRLIAAELAGDVIAMSDDLADTLLAIIRNDEEPEELRARGAISLGPVLELAYMDHFDDPESVPITEPKFRNIQAAFQ